MNYRPRESVIYNSESVLAILKGSKTQTRRVIEPQPTDPEINSTCEYFNSEGDHAFWWSHDYGPEIRENDPIGEMFRCPYGVPGHELWVKEKIYYNLEQDNFYYAADHRGCGQEVFNALNEQFGRDAWLKRPYRSARYMPKVCRRIQLRVSSVRVQRIQEITFTDIRAEGVSCPDHDFHSGFCVSECPSLRSAWSKGWDLINAKRGFPWSKNPWVWAITFQRLKP